jgi:hypothetical protein
LNEYTHVCAFEEERVNFFPKQGMLLRENFFPKQGMLLRENCFDTVQHLMIYSSRDSAAKDTHQQCDPFLEPGELGLKVPHSRLLLPNNLLLALILLDLLIQNVLHSLHFSLNEEQN